MKLCCLCLVAAAIGLAGCHHSETVYSGPGGTAKVDQSNGSTTIETTNDKGDKVTETIDPGKVTAIDNKGYSHVQGADVVSEADLGLPFYPGSTANDMGSSKTQTDKGTFIQSIRTTADDPDKVGDFYKDKVEKPEKNDATTPSAKVLGLKGKRKDGADVVITAIAERGKSTTVTVSVSKIKG